MLLRVQGQRAGQVDLRRPELASLRRRLSDADWYQLTDCQRRMRRAVQRYMNLKTEMKVNAFNINFKMGEYIEAMNRTMKTMEEIQAEQSEILDEVREQIAAEVALTLPKPLHPPAPARSPPPPPPPPEPEEQPQLRLVIQPLNELKVTVKVVAERATEQTGRSSRAQLPARPASARLRLQKGRGEPSAPRRPAESDEELAPVPDPGPEPPPPDDYRLNIPRDADPDTHAKNCHMAALGLVVSEFAERLRTQVRHKPRRQAFDLSMADFLYTNWRKRKTFAAPAVAAKRPRVDSRKRKKRARGGRQSRATSPATEPSSRAASPATEPTSRVGSPEVTEEPPSDAPSPATEPVSQAESPAPGEATSPPDGTAAEAAPRGTAAAESAPVACDGSDVMPPPPPVRPDIPQTAEVADVDMEGTTGPGAAECPRSAPGYPTSVGGPAEQAESLSPTDSASAPHDAADTGDAPAETDTTPIADSAGLTGAECEPATAAATTTTAAPTTDPGTPDQTPPAARTAPAVSLPRFTGTHERRCGRCAGVGQLLACDTCPRVFHVTCVGCAPAADEDLWSCPECCAPPGPEERGEEGDEGGKADGDGHASPTEQHTDKEEGGDEGDEETNEETGEDKVDAEVEEEEGCAETEADVGGAEIGENEEVEQDEGGEEVWKDEDEVRKHEGGAETGADEGEEERVAEVETGEEVAEYGRDEGAEVGEDEEGAEVGEDEEGAEVGEDEEGAEVGEDEEGAEVGEDEEGAEVGEDDGGAEEEEGEEVSQQEGDEEAEVWQGVEQEVDGMEDEDSMVDIIEQVEDEDTASFQEEEEEGVDATEEEVDLEGVYATEEEEEEEVVDATEEEEVVLEDVDAMEEFSFDNEGTNRTNDREYLKEVTGGEANPNHEDETMQDV